MINIIIIDTLKDLGIPIYYQKTTTKHDKYIIFSIYLEQDSSFYDDENLSEKYYITLNYWYKNASDMSLYKEIKNKLKSNGFSYKDGKDLEDGDYFGKNLDFIYELEKEGE